MPLSFHLNYLDAQKKAAARPPPRDSELGTRDLALEARDSTSYLPPRSISTTRS